MSWYTKRYHADPAWRREQIAAARAREQARKEADPEGFRAYRREVTRRWRARQKQRGGLTFTELRDRCLIDGYPDGEGTLRRVLAQEVRLGRIEYHSTSRRYLLNGGLDSDLCEALLGLTDSAAMMN